MRRGRSSATMRRRAAEERRLCGDSFAYACAYTARCGHAGGGDAREQPGTFQNLLWSERANLLDL